MHVITTATMTAVFALTVSLSSGQGMGVAYRCEDDQIHCGIAGRCLNRARYACNGVNDCGNFADEQDCPTPAPTPRPIPVYTTCYPAGQPQLYRGTRDTDIWDHSCLPWSHEESQYNSPSQFVDGYVPSNYCRRPLDNSRGYPWCYILDYDTVGRCATRGNYGIPECADSVGEAHFTCYGVNCFAYFGQPETWPNAWAVCARHGGFLAEATSSATAQQVQNTRPSQNHIIWLGGNDRAIEGDWKWQHSGTNIPMTGEPGFQAWHWPTNEPNNDGGEENCLVLEGDGVWNDRSCTYALSFVCQRERDLLSSCYPEGQPELYRGDVSVTVTNKVCQAWDDQSPHTHHLGDSPEDFTDQRWPDNFCRQPLDDTEPRPWCYTTDPGSRWEYCDISVCPV